MSYLGQWLPQGSMGHIENRTSEVHPEANYCFCHIPAPFSGRFSDHTDLWAPMPTPMLATP